MEKYVTWSCNWLLKPCKMRAQWNGSAPLLSRQDLWSSWSQNTLSDDGHCNSVFLFSSAEWNELKVVEYLDWSNSGGFSRALSVSFQNNHNSQLQLLSDSIEAMTHKVYSNELLRRCFLWLVLQIFKNFSMKKEMVGNIIMHIIYWQLLFCQNKNINLL